MDKVHYSSKTDLHATPQEFFDRLNEEFNFTLDVCATADNAKCVRYYSKIDDALSMNWSSCFDDGSREVIWMNPPYGRDIVKWIKKAHEASQDGCIVVCLVPSRTDTKWWHDYVMQHEVRFVRGRLKFGNAKNSAPFPSAVIVMRHKNG